MIGNLSCLVTNYTQSKIECGRNFYNEKVNKKTDTNKPLDVVSPENGLEVVEVDEVVEPAKIGFKTVN